MIKASIAQCDNLVGRINSKVKLVGTIHSEGRIIGYLSKPVGYEEYKGTCDIEPDVSPQVICTKNKLMTKDVTVKAVPYYEVENTQGGTTIIIGG